MCETNQSYLQYTKMDSRVNDFDSMGNPPIAVYNGIPVRDVYYPCMDLLEQCKEVIARHALINPGDAVLVALSGGPDSVALLHLLTRLRDSLDLTLGAVYVNHQIRRRAAAIEARFCQSLCDTLEVDITIVVEDIPSLAKAEKKGIEETAREFRYGVFDAIAEADDYDRVAVGHQADDQVETILFRFLRGAGRTGLLGIPVKRGRIIRPLLETPREDILAYLKDAGLSWCHDRTNDSPQYARNFIRTKLLPAIRERLNPSVERALLSTAELLADEERLLNKYMLLALRRCASVTTGGKIQLARTAYLRYDKVLRRRLLRRCCQFVSGRTEAPDREVIERLDRFCQEPSAALSLPDGIRALFVPADCIILRRNENAVVHTELPVGESTHLANPAITFRVVEPAKRTPKVDKRRRSQSILIDRDCVSGPLVVRSIRPGDRFRPLGMRGRKKVGDYLTDRKAPAALRDEVLVVCDAKGIVWLVGYEVDDRVKITAATRKVLRIDARIAKTTAVPAD